MSVLSYLLFLIILPTLVFRTMQDKREYSRFKKLSSTYQRQSSYKKWALESFLMFGIGGLIMLIATDNVALLFDTNKRLAQALPYFNELRSSQELRPILIGAALSVLLTPIISHVSRDSKKKPLIGDVHAMIPRNNPERIWMGLLSINAGFSEEIFFRVLLPALLLAVTGNGLLSLGLACTVFGLIHWYQGWAGVIFTSIWGVVFTYVYFLSGNVLIAMGVHALIDLNAAIIEPSLSKARITGQRRKDASTKQKA